MSCVRMGVRVRVCQRVSVCVSVCVRMCSCVSACVRMCSRVSGTTSLQHGEFTDTLCLQSKAKQSKAKQSKAKQSKAKQSKAKQSKAKQSKAKQLLRFASLWLLTCSPAAFSVVPFFPASFLPVIILVIDFRLVTSTLTSFLPFIFPFVVSTSLISCPLVPPYLLLYCHFFPCHLTYLLMPDCSLGA